MDDLLNHLFQFWQGSVRKILWQSLAYFVIDKTERKAFKDHYYRKQISI